MFDRITHFPLLADTQMDPFGVTNEQEGIRIAERALDELRVFLHNTSNGAGRTAPGSSRAPPVTFAGEDLDVALHEQLHNLEEMLRMITDARFARSLIEDDNERAAIGYGEDAENLDLLRIIVITARDVMAFRTYDDDFDLPDVGRGNRNGPAGLSRESPPSPLSVWSDDDFEPDPVSCTVCAEELLSKLAGHLETPCGHYYCSRCAINLVNSYISQLFPSGPFRCCPAPQPPIPLQLVHQFIDMNTRRTLEDKIAEASTPYDEKIYCPQEACRRFINPAKITPAARTDGNVVCPSMTCRVNICLGCKRLTHQGVNCEKNADDLDAVSIQKRYGWGRCPGCGFVVEKIDGCNSVACTRCGRGFSYQPLA